MKILRYIHWILDSQFGINLIKFLFAFVYLPAFLRDLWIASSWKSINKLSIKPCLHDKYDNAGSSLSEYFFQDLFVANLVNNYKPNKLLDIGSRIDGFVANVASFRCLDVMDVRPMSGLPENIRFIEKDLMSSEKIIEQYDMITCLHAIEHFGLGRYGDSLSEDGHISGLRNMAKYLSKDGRLILSTPVGEGKLLFNANRVFGANELLHIFTNLNLKVERIWVLEVDTFRATTRANLIENNNEYNLTIFQLTKEKEHE